MTLVIRFEGLLWEYEGDTPWVFVTLPGADADDIREVVPHPGGFGSVPVEATIGDVVWRTSVFPDKGSGSFVLPVKRRVRDRAGIDVGDTAPIELRIAP